MNFITKLKQKFRNFGIENLMLYVVIAQAIVLVFSYLFINVDLPGAMSFVRSSIFAGQIWRVVTFIFLPPTYSLIWALFVFLLYYSIGRELEHHWGKSNFTLYYLIGVIGSIVGGFISGYATVTYLNLSLFLAYAAVFPNTEFRIYFLIPIKAKYLAYIDAAFLIFEMIISPVYVKVSILFAFLNFFIFFGGDFINRIKSKRRYNKFKNDFNNSER